MYTDTRPGIGFRLLGCGSASIGATRLLVRVAQSVLLTDASTTIARPAAMIVHQSGCASTTSDDPTFALPDAPVMVPASAMPSAVPTWRPVEVIAAAAPPCAFGIPLTAVFVIGAFTSPNPAPNIAKTTRISGIGEVAVVKVSSTRRGGDDQARQRHRQPRAARPHEPSRDR